jgi:flagellar biosynthesis/type III secretory pathway chaperone
MDRSLADRLNELWKQSDRLKEVEGRYLELEANKKSLLAQLTITAQGKSFAEREAQALASADYKNFLAALVEAETAFNFERRKWEILDKAYLAEYSTFKIEDRSIRKAGA